MLKDVQIKIVLIFFLLGIVIISGLGIYFSINLEEINNIILVENGMQNKSEIIRINWKSNK